MIALPFIYFTLLTVFFYRQRGIDPSTYISLLFTITTGCSVLLASDSLFAYYNKSTLESVTIVPTFLFCFLITLAIVPVYKFNFKRINCIALNSDRFIILITYVFFICFLLHLVLYFRDFIRTLALGSEMAELRAGLYKGDQLQLTSYPPLVEMLALPFKVLADFSYVMIFIYFFSLSTKKLSLRMHIMMILGSLSSVFVGILGVDRSKSFYWVILAGLSYVLFYHFMNKQVRRYIMRVGILVVGLIVTYFIIMTIVRFRDTGVSSGILVYAGQSFINFCDFWTNYSAPDGVTLKHLFPSISHFIFDNYDGAVNYQEKMTRLSGMECGVFYTYLGTFIISAGKMGPFIITMSYLVLASFVMKRNRGMVTFSKMLYMFLLLVIPSSGFIAYIYASTFITLTIVFLVIMIKFIKDKKISYYHKTK